MLLGGLLVITLLAPPRAGKPIPQPPAAASLSKLSSAELLARAQALFAALEYDQVLPVTEAALSRTDLPLESRLEAYRLQGSARAIVMDPLEAESSFRLLLRARSDYELPAGTPPKILAVFRKVQTEERALEQTLREVERARTVASLSLIGEPASPAQGGLPLRFSFRVKDPTGAVDLVRVPFRRAGEKAWSTLALERNEGGSWEGRLSGEVTASPSGFKLEYYVETADARGVLLTRGTALLPQQLPVTPGFVPVRVVKPISRPVFITSAAVTVALGLVSAGLGIALQLKQAEFRTLTPPGSTVDGAVVQRVRADGETLATATTVTLIASGAALITTAVMVPLTAFSE